MKILLLGRNGQVGWELQRALAPLGDLIACDRTQADLTDDRSLIDAVHDHAPEIIVNAAAYTAVDKAESEPEAARRINAAAPATLAREAAKTGALLVHYSTDYVFDGNGTTPWSETAPVAPLNTYGQTKLEGEQAIQSSGCRHIIFRTSWVYGARGGNFAKTMLRLARERDAMTVINDQHGAPTGADLLADCTAHAIRTGQHGLYHLAAAGETTWFDYARFVLEYAERRGIPLKTPASAIQPVPSSGFPSPARRPHNSRLDTAKFRNTYHLVLPPWQTGVQRMLDEVLETMS